VKHLAQKDQKGLKALEGSLGKLSKMLECADENGLFKNRSETHESIIESICAASDKIEQGKQTEAYKEFCSAYHKFNNAVNSSSVWWRFTYSFGGPVIVFFVGIMISIFLVWFFFSNVIVDSKILWVPSWAFLWGSMGGILQGFWRLWQHVSDRRLRKNWFIWFFLLPLMGAVLGALVYLIYFAGFIVSTGETQLTSEFFAMLLSALAGFSSWWAVKLLNTLTEIIQISGARAR